MPEQQYSAYNPDEPEGPGPVGYLAIVLAWAVPGLGHMMIGQKARGLVFMITIHGLFAAGLLIGGIRSIKPPDQAIWTYTQRLTGWPMIIASKLEDDFDHDYVARQSNGLTIMQKRYHDDAAKPRHRPQRPCRPPEVYRRLSFRNTRCLPITPKVQDMGASSTAALRACSTCWSCSTSYSA